MFNIKFSKRTTSLKKFDATFPYIIFAQLVALGYTPVEAAWAVCFAFNKYENSDSTKTLDRIKEKAKEMMEREKIQILIKHFQDEIALAADGQSTIALDTLISQKINESGEMDKQTTAMELLRIANTLPDGKEKADLLMKYADIMGYKKTDEKDASVRHTMFYLPATCSTCPLVTWLKANHPEALDRKQPTPE